MRNTAATKQAPFNYYERAITEHKKRNSNHTYIPQHLFPLKVNRLTISVWGAPRAHRAERRASAFATSPKLQLLSFTSFVRNALDAVGLLSCWCSLLKAREFIATSGTVHTSFASEDKALWLFVCAGGLDIMKLIKTPLIYSASRFNLGGLEFCLGGKAHQIPPWRRDCIVWHPLDIHVGIIQPSFKIFPTFLDCVVVTA